jgi:hypothetical protein
VRQDSSVCSALRARIRRQWRGGKRAVAQDSFVKVAVWWPAGQGPATNRARLAGLSRKYQCRYNECGLAPVACVRVCALLALIQLH